MLGVNINNPVEPPHHMSNFDMVGTELKGVQWDIEQLKGLATSSE